MRVAAAVGACFLFACADTIDAQPAPLIESDSRVKDSEPAACDVLKAHVGATQPGKRLDRRWSCDFTSIPNDYVRIVGLRSSRTLLGWYGVSRGGHAVFEWDVAGWRFMAGQARGVVDDSPAAACELAKARVAALLASAPSEQWRCDLTPGDDLFYFMTLWRSPSRDVAAARIGAFAVARRGDLVAGIDERTKRIVALRAR